MLREVFLIASLAGSVGFAGVAAGGPAEGSIRLLTFEVEVPSGTPADAEIHVCGNQSELGTWSGGGLKLQRTAEGRYGGELHAAEGTLLEFKITRGSWGTVEKGADGSEIANRTHLVARDGTIRIRVAGWAGGAAPRTSTLTGTVRFHPDFESKRLNNRRTIAIYLPPGYDEKSDTRYPVFYMQDGQNLFDAATSFRGIEWGADETAERLIREKRIEPLIIVGIYNTPDRMNEYTPVQDAKGGAGGLGSRYAAFVVEEVKPFIDRTYRTRLGRESTGVGGSSLGGLISLQICSLYPEEFSKCAIVSPALWWGDHALVKTVEAKPDWVPRTRFWLDMGTREGTTLASFSNAIQETRRLAAAFESAGLSKGTGYAYEEVEGAVHDEGAWAKRMDRILLFLYGIDSKS